MATIVVTTDSSYYDGLAAYSRRSGLGSVVCISFGLARHVAFVLFTVCVRIAGTDGKKWRCSRQCSVRSARLCDTHLAAQQAKQQARSGPANPKPPQVRVEDGDGGGGLNRGGGRGRGDDDSEHRKRLRKHAPSPPSAYPQCVNHCVVLPLALRLSSVFSRLRFQEARGIDDDTDKCNVF